MVDTILSGHLPSAAVLGGVAVGGIFFNSIYWTFGFLRMATTGLVAQSHGAGDKDQLMYHFGRALLTALLRALILDMLAFMALRATTLGLRACPESNENPLPSLKMRSRYSSRLEEPSKALK